MGFLIDNVPDLKKHGAYHTGPCPMCGGRDRFVVKTFEDGREGWLCRGCAGGSYRSPENYLVERFGISYQQARQAIESGGYHSTHQPPARPAAQPEPPAPPRRPTYWQRNAERLIRDYTSHPGRVELWNNYKPLPTETIVRAELGVGILPSSRCKHERLIVPVRDSFGRVVCFRGRRIACNCTDEHGRLKKWTTSAGWRLDGLPLYNLAPDSKGVIYIVENPIDALMIDAFTEYNGVATLSTSYWRQVWTASLLETAPSLVIVAYDNDLAGNGGGKHREGLIENWRKTVPAGAPIPTAYGQVLAVTLREAGLPVVLYDWAGSPAGEDIGSLLRRVSHEPESIAA